MTWGEPEAIHFIYIKLNISYSYGEHFCEFYKQYLKCCNSTWKRITLPPSNFTTEAKEKYEFKNNGYRTLVRSYLVAEFSQVRRLLCEYRS